MEKPVARAKAKGMDVKVGLYGALLLSMLVAGAISYLGG